MIRIKEQHGPQSPGIYDQRISLVLDPALHQSRSRVVHKFDAQQRSRHAFVLFSGRRCRKISSGSATTHVVVTSGKEIQGRRVCSYRPTVWW